jgi:hypothetical protein
LMLQNGLKKPKLARSGIGQTSYYINE